MFATSFRLLFNSPSNENITFYKSDVFPNVNTEIHFNLFHEESALTILNNISTEVIGDDGISVYDLKICLPSCLPSFIHIIISCILKPLPKTKNPKELNDSILS